MSTMFETPAAPVAATPQATPPEVLRQRIADAEATIRTGKPAPKPAEPELTPEAKIAAWDAEQRAKGNQKPQTVADVPDDYRPERPPSFPGVNAHHTDKIAFHQSETARMRRIYEGAERPRTSLELELTNRAREAAGLLPIAVVTRKGVDPDAYSSTDDLIALGVHVPVLAAPQRDSSRADPAALARVDAHHKPSKDMSEAARAAYERDLRAVHDGIAPGENMDTFRARMLKGTAEQTARWTDGDRTDADGQTVPGPMSTWISAAQERAAKIGDPRIVTLVQLAAAHVEGGLRIAEFQATRNDMDRFLSAIERGEATWTADLDAEVAAMRGASHRATERSRVESEQVAELLKLAKAPKDAREAAAALAGKIHKDGCTHGEHIPAALASGYDLSLLRGHEVDVAGTLAELATARELGATQAQVEAHIRQRFGLNAA